MAPGLNFINILRSTYARADSKSAMRSSQFFAFLWSERAKAALKWWWNWHLLSKFQVLPTISTTIDSMAGTSTLISKMGASSNNLDRYIDNNNLSKFKKWPSFFEIYFLRCSPWTSSRAPRLRLPTRDFTKKSINALRKA